MRSKQRLESYWLDSKLREQDPSARNKGCLVVAGRFALAGRTEEEFFQHRLTFDRSSLTRWRQRIGEEKLHALLQESVAVATKTKTIKPTDLNRVIVDTTCSLRT